MDHSRRRAPKCCPVSLNPRDVLPLANSFCFSCGSCNIVVFEQASDRGSIDQRLLKCQSCGVISPDFSRSQPQSGFRTDYTSLNKTRVHRKKSQLSVLDAFTHQHTKHKLQRALADAQEDLGSICHKYLPLAIEVFAHVVSLFGFSDNIQGVTESVRIMQTHARDDDELVQKLVSIRKLLTPSANWIQDDRNAERDEERRRELDMQMIEQKNEEARRKEVATQEEAKQERLRAKKIALGLNPAVVRPPVLVDKPPPLVVAVKNSHVELRVNANFAQKFQWFFNSHPIETEAFVSGINRCALVIAKLTKRVMGEYFCICENEEGTVTSPTCLVLLAALKVSRLVSTSLETLSKSPMYSCETNMMLTAIGNSIHLYDAKSLDTITAFPALPMAIKTLAWDPQTKLLTAFSASIPQKNMTAATQILFYSPKRHTAGFSKSDFPTTFSRQRNNNKRGPAIKPQMPSRGNSLQFQLMDVQSVDTLTEVCAAEFLDSGKRLLLTDMKHQVALYDFSPLFEWKQTISFDSDVICHVTASPRSPALFALAFRNKPFVKLFSSTTDDKTRYRSLSEHRVAFKFPAHRTSFDALGHFLAVAETGFMKSWISIVNVNTKRSSKRRFIAHAGNISGLQWTTSTSLLLSSSHDGYVKVWDPVAMSNLLSIHIDKHGIHSMLLMEELALLLVLGHSGRRLQSQQVLQLPQLEASRLVEMNRQAANVQKRVKGRKTREFLATVIKNSR